jgi:hypothetical protein
VDILKAVDAEWGLPHSSYWGLLEWVDSSKAKKNHPQPYKLFQFRT